MNITWQDVFAAAIVLTAVAYLARTLYRMLLARQSGCGSCGSCPGEGDKARKLVSLNLAGQVPVNQPSAGAKASGPIEKP